MSLLLTQTSRMRGAALGASLAAALAMAPAQAADTVDVTVNATIVGVCKFFGGPYTLTIANSGTDIDPSAAGPATGSVQVEYRCSNGTNPGFTVPASLNLTGAGTMQATFTSSNDGAGTGMGNAQAKQLTINGSIGAGEYADKPVGAYSGTLTVSVNP